MQSSLFFASPLSLKPNKSMTPDWRSPNPQRPIVVTRIKATVNPDTSTTVDYTSSTSVFPAEACDTVGGAACEAKMYPEVKPKADDGPSKTRKVLEEVDREYLEYGEAKTVFPGEACDDLGGEFCEPEYQDGVYKDKI